MRTPCQPRRQGSDAVRRASRLCQEAGRGACQAGRKVRKSTGWSHAHHHRRECRYSAVITLRKATDEPLKDALALWEGQPPKDTWEDRQRCETIRAWDCPEVRTLDTFDGPLRVVRAEVTSWRTSQTTTWCAVALGEHGRRLPLRRIHDIQRARWHEENTAFHQWTTQWKLGRAFRHSPEGVRAVLRIWTLTFNLLQLFCFRRTPPAPAAARPQRHAPESRPTDDRQPRSNPRTSLLGGAWRMKKGRLPNGSGPSKEPPRILSKPSNRRPPATGKETRKTRQEVTPPSSHGKPRPHRQIQTPPAPTCGAPARLANSLTSVGSGGENTTRSGRVEASFRSTGTPTWRGE